jgi:hypothetical protein
MRCWKSWLYAICGLAAAVVAVAAAAQAIREGSWTPIVSVAWLPAVVVAVWPGMNRRCLPRRRTPVRR